MSIRELQEVLHDHADEVVDTAVAGRASAARRQAVGIRRRRRAVGALVVAVAVPVLGVAFGGDRLVKSDREVPPAGKGHVVELPMAASFAGRELVRSWTVVDSQELVVAVPAGERIEVHGACFGVGPKYTVKATIDGRGHAETLCEKTRPDISQFSYTLSEDESKVPHTLRLWVTPNYPDLPAAPQGGFLQAAVYRTPPVAAYVTGQELFELEHSDTDDYALSSYRESRPGSRAFRSTFEAQDRITADVYSNLSTSNAENKVTVIFDGIRQNDFWLGHEARNSVGTKYKGSHTIELRIRGDVPPDAVLGVVWRTIER